MITGDEARPVFSHHLLMESSGFRFWQIFLQWQGKSIKQTVVVKYG